MSIRAAPAALNLQFIRQLELYESDILQKVANGICQHGVA
jgi:hypothetical protein